MESSCLTKSPSSSSDLRTLSISLFSFCLTFPSTSIILFRGPLVYPLISGNIRQPKMEPFLRQYSQNRVCYVVYRVTGSSRNKPMRHTLSDKVVDCKGSPYYSILQFLCCSVLMHRTVGLYMRGHLGSSLFSQAYF